MAGFPRPALCRGGPGALFWPIPIEAATVRGTRPGGSPILVDLLIVFALILANGFFAGAEIAVVAIRKTRIQELVDHGSRAARAVAALRDEPERFLATVQIGITVVGTTAAAVGGASIGENLVPALIDVGITPERAQSIALVAVVLLVSYLEIVVGELVPKSLALRAAERYSLLVGRPLLLLSYLARPLVWFLTVSSNAVLRPFGDRTTFTETRHSPEELQQLVEEATKAGTVDPGAGEIVARALDFPELTVADVMVPRQEVLMIPREATLEDIRAALLDSIHTRIPVVDGGPDNVVGYVHVKDLLERALSHKELRVTEVMRPATFVPEIQRAVDLLNDMRKKHIAIAMVVDEQGGLSGIVTMEDLLEELVGEIFSEHVDHVPQLIRRDPDGSALVSGAAPLRDVNRDLGLELPEEGDYTTVAGLCIAVAGRIPQKGDRLTTDNDIELEVVDASPRRIFSVRIRPFAE
jgi:putative hemolysin